MNKEKSYDTIVISHFFYPRVGGLENHAYGLIKYLSNRGQKCLSIHANDKAGFYNLEGFDCKSFNPFCIFNGTYPLFGLRYISYVLSVIRLNPQAKVIIYSRHLLSSLYAAFVCKILGLPYILIEQTAESSFFNSKIENILIRIVEKLLFSFVIRNANDIICVSNASKDFIIDFFKADKNNIQVIFNGFNEDSVPNPDMTKKENIVLFNTKMMVVKDPKTSFSAFLKLSSEYPDWKFIVVGDGNELDYDGKTLPSNIEIVPKLLPQNKSFEIVSRSKIYVNSSLSEGLSLAVVEAAALGCIPVLSDAPSNVEIARKLAVENLVFKRKSIEELCSQIRKAIQISIDSRPYESIRSLAYKNFASNKLFEQYFDYLFASHKIKDIDKLSIVIPAYNEEKTMVSLLEKVVNIQLNGIKKEVIIVNDASTDSTQELIGKFINKIQNKIDIKVLTNKKNLGKSQSVKKGVLASSGDLVVVQDADLEYNPKELEDFVQEFIKHPQLDVVYGDRFNSRGKVIYLHYYLGNKLLTMISNLFTSGSFKVNDMEVCYKMVRGDILKEIAQGLESKSTFGLEPEITAKLAQYRKINGERLNLKQIPISYNPRTREEGKKITVFRDGINALFEILRFNVRPMIKNIDSIRFFNLFFKIFSNRER